MPNGTFGPVCAARGSALAGSTSGSSRTGGAGSPGHATASVSTILRSPSGRLSAAGWASIRGSAVRKWRPSRVMPRPGEPSGTLAASLRSTSDSYGSPSRSSSRVPNRSRMAGRNSDHLPVAASTCTP